MGFKHISSGGAQAACVGLGWWARVGREPRGHRVAIGANQRGVRARTKLALEERGGAGAEEREDSEKEGGGQGWPLRVRCLAGRRQQAPHERARGDSGAVRTTNIHVPSGAALHD